MERRHVNIAIGVLIAAILGVWGFFYIKDMPGVSAADSKRILEQYREDLQQLYSELNDTYGSLRDSGDSAGWQEFSKDWMPRLVGIRPDALDRKFPEGYEGKKELLMTVQKELIPLWNEYNRYFTGEEVNQERIDELRNIIEGIFDSIDI